MEALKTLVARTLAQDLDAYGEIVRRFQYLAYGYAFALLGDAHLAEDMAQEAFLEAYQNLAKLDQPDAFPGWLRKIVLKRCDRLIRLMRPRTSPLETAGQVADRRPGPSAAAEQRELKNRILDAIARLPENERTVTTLFYIDGYSQCDIADFLELPVSTVNNRLHASREALRERMETVIGEALHADAPQPDALAERITFLCAFAGQLQSGVPVVTALENMQKTVKAARMREVVQDFLKSVLSGSSMTEVFIRYKDLFPPMVVRLIDDGETFCVVDQSLQQAGEWLKTGKFKTDPAMFDNNFSLFRIRGALTDALQAGAKALVVDSSRSGPMPGGKFDALWIEHEQDDGSLKRTGPIGRPEILAKLQYELKVRTRLNAEQEGDCLAGTLRLRLSKDGGERSFPITYRPLADGDQIRIELNYSE